MEVTLEFVPVEEALPLVKACGMSDMVLMNVVDIEPGDFGPSQYVIAGYLQLLTNGTPVWLNSSHAIVEELGEKVTHWMPFPPAIPYERNEKVA